METLKSEWIAQAIDVIINTRDFCGNEREAVYELANELGLNREQKRSLYRSANFHANAKWNEYQKAAGVNPKYTF